MQTHKTLRVVHLTIYKDLPSSIRNQIKWEQTASRRLKDVKWSSIAVHCGTPLEQFEKSIPIPFRPMFLRNIYGWLIAIQLARTHDVLLMRHMPFDPFALLFAPFIRNRVSIHHSLEWEELPLIRPGLVGRLAGALERMTGFVAVRTAMGVLGVTAEIAQSQVERRAPGKQACLYVNGIDLDTVDEAMDLRIEGVLSVVFMCTTFSKWHGLDRVIDAVHNACAIPDGLIIHLIGHISDSQKQQIAALGSRAEVFYVHGFLKIEAYQALLAEADVGLASFALDRKNMREATTLKVREMLGKGLPVYSGHTDTALSPDFPFYHQVTEVDIENLAHFARDMKQFTRSDVRTAAAPFIEKSVIMQSTADWLHGLCAGGLNRPRF